MERCTAIVLPANKTTKKKTDPTFVDKCSQITLPARAAAVRAVARYAAPLLDTCGVQKASDESAFEPTPISRPTRKENAEAEPLPPEPEMDEEEKISVRVTVAKAANLPKADFMGSADPYVEFLVLSGNPLDVEVFRPKDIAKGHDSKAVDAKTVFKAKTKTIRGTLAPVFEDGWTFELPRSETAGELFFYFRVYDYDMVTSDDFLGHTSMSLMEALVASRDLSSGWRALLRSCPNVCDRLDLLRDERLKSRAMPPQRLQPVPGQEKTYDLSTSELYLEVDLPRKPPERPKFGAGKKGQSPRSSSEKESSQRELLRAALDGNVPLVRSALAAGAAVNGTVANGPFKGCSPLNIACLKRFPDCAMAFVDVFNASLVQHAPGGRSPAMCACEGGDEALAEWLIMEGVPVDLRDDCGRTVLFYAAKFSLTQLTSWLIGKQKQSPNQRSADGSTPLMSASSNGLEANVVVVQQLLDAHASANAKNKAGQTALHFACEAGDDRCALLLLKLGARPDILDEKGRTAFDVARSSGMPVVMVQRLRNSGADVEEGVGVGSQRHGESAEDAKKRELRAKKDEVSAARDWSSWRQAHPWRGLTPDRSTGERRKAPAYASVNDDDPFPDSPRSAERADSPRSLGLASRDDIPVFIGSIGSALVEDGAAAKKPGRLTRLKTWASRIGPSRSKSPPPPTRSQSERAMPPARSQSASAFSERLANWSDRKSVV